MPTYKTAACRQPWPACEFAMIALQQLTEQKAVAEQMFPAKLATSGTLWLTPPQAAQTHASHQVTCQTCWVSVFFCSSCTCYFFTPYTWHAAHMNPAQAAGNQHLQLCMLPGPQAHPAAGAGAAWAAAGGGGTATRKHQLCSSKRHGSLRSWMPDEASADGVPANHVPRSYRCPVLTHADQR